MIKAEMTMPVVFAAKSSHSACLPRGKIACNDSVKMLQKKATVIPMVNLFFHEQNR